MSTEVDELVLVREKTDQVFLEWITCMISADGDSRATPPYDKRE